MLVCPGGGFQALHLEHEGHRVAEVLRRLGVTVWVLKHRLVPSVACAAQGLSPGVFQSHLSVVHLDLMTAWQRIQEHPLGRGLDRLGLLGFGSGSRVVLEQVFRPPGNARKVDFVGVFSPEVEGVGTSSGALPPLFVGVEDGLRSVAGLRLEFLWGRVGQQVTWHQCPSSSPGVEHRGWLEFRDWLGVL
ncbi:hypothetical protein GCM10008938_47840 [Deinococcus roseus]|uniref:Dienelactone hydrolase domain-containing protein n=1 Tax=Deinococcus roseus TaxID=392414 RepID=A0ABQ2DH75_9DEIO|nr:hypothetical protein GCM10008938_47840 [Deinococcus roseus]